jgi:hypothetical protein
MVTNAAAMQAVLVHPLPMMLRRLDVADARPFSGASISTRLRRGFSRFLVICGSRSSELLPLLLTFA